MHIVRSWHEDSVYKQEILSAEESKNLPSATLYALLMYGNTTQRAGDGNWRNDRHLFVYRQFNTMCHCSS